MSLFEDAEKLQKHDNELIEKTRVENIDNIVKTIEINDSYFYASMVIYRVPMDFHNPFNEPCIKAKIKINLFNSKDFSYDNITNDKKILQAKVIETIVDINLDATSSNDLLMNLIYNEISKQITRDLFQNNMSKITSTIIDYNCI